MRFREVAILCCAVAALAIAPSASAQQDEPSFVDGVVNFFRSIFGGTEEEQAAPAAAPSPAAPATSGAPGAGESQAAAKERPRPQAEADPIKTAPVALVAPQSLHAVVAKGDFENARKLIEQGADIEAKDPGTGASVLHYAVMRGNPDILQFLLGRGVDVNSRTRNGTTPLHTAVLYNRYEVAEMLLNKGAEVDAKSTSGATPLAIATAAKNRTIAELLRKRGAK
jgi:ankyrin repeat protein